ncbi:Holliday junction resolvase RuvX [Flagellimonas sp. DF-77]|uniref:Holliday junction resolvase RuvX n=1 Tax=Flagellimonas algarum TaxID=3230298 RepID=UPI0033976F1F
MGIILALDFGTVRTGLAVTDELQLIASGLRTVATTELMDFLKEYLAENAVETLVIGEPKRMDGSPSEVESEIVKFIVKLKEYFPELPVVRQDERFTSKMAARSLVDSRVKKKQRQNKALLDEVSATLILQAYLERR